MGLWSEMRRLQRQMDSLFGEFHNHQPQPSSATKDPTNSNEEKSLSTTTNPWRQDLFSMMPRQWSPLCDVRETEKAVVVHAELPGIPKEDIEVEVENQRLHIRGERKQESKEEKEQFHRVERSFGCFHRSILLPQGVDASAIQANHKDGVLEVIIPKPEPPKGHRITIN
ncbi:Heat-shock protein Hsp20 [Balamuthia mandrillaris]